MYEMLNTHTEVALDVIERLSADEIRASIEQIRHQDRTTAALRAALKAGVSIDNLSAASGLTCDEINRRLNRTPLFEDLASLAGLG